MIFAFMDESGHPHPKDQSTRPVLVTVCLDAGYLRTVNTEVFRLKKRILQRDSFDFEMKAKKLITPAARFPTTNVRGLPPHAISTPALPGEQVIGIAPAR